MLDRFFGVPQQIMRDGTWAKMHSAEKDLYLALMHDSERYSTRELRLKDVQIRALTGLSSRTFCNARKQLIGRGLIQCRRGKGNIFTYVICNPYTGQPWPQDPRIPLVYKSKAVAREEPPPVEGLAGVFSN